MELATLEVTAWLDRGPAHQLFRSDDGRLAYRILPTASQDIRRQARGMVERVAKALNQPGATVPHGAEMQVGDNEELVLVTEGVEAASVVGLKDPLPPVMALGLASRLLQGLVPIHETGLYHAALTPGRILLSSDGSPTVMDLGMAYLTEADSDRRLAPSVPGFAELFPIPALIPPEVFNWKPLTPASDIFLIAALVYRWMTGVYAHQGERVMDVYAALRDGRREPFPKLPANLNLAAIRVLERALDPEPDNRPQAAELVTALRPFAGIGLKPLVDQAGEPGNYADSFDQLAPEDAPGPPGSVAEKRRQEILKRATLQLEVMKNQRDAGLADSPRTTGGTKRRRSGLWSWVVVIALLGAIGALTPYFLEQLKQRGGVPTGEVVTNNSRRPEPKPEPEPEVTQPDATAAPTPGTMLGTPPPEPVGTDPGTEPGGLVVTVGGPNVKLDIKRRQPEIEVHQGRYLEPESPRTKKK